MSDSAAATPAAIPFSLGSTPLLAGGHSRLSLVQGDGLSGHVMVIAEGGEVTLHAHNHEEHLFLVLSGEVRFSFLPPPRSSAAGAPGGDPAPFGLLLQLLQRRRTESGDGPCRHDPRRRGQPGGPRWPAAAWQQRPGWMAAGAAGFSGPAASRSVSPLPGCWRRRAQLRPQGSWWKLTSTAWRRGM